MQSSLFSRFRFRRMLGPLMGLALIVLLVAIWYLTSQSGSPAKIHVDNAVSQNFHAGPPWRYGRADARFTLVLYADLECPYCKSYYPLLRAWIDRNPETNLQWHHLPLPMHEPAASRQAQLAECAGEVDGHAAFWQAVTWIYQQTRSDGAGIPENVQYPSLTPAMQACIDSTRTEAIIQAQANEGSREGVAATPTLKLSDNQSGRTLVLPGPVEGDALLSALDLLSIDGDTDQGRNTGTPATGSSTEPR
ncbi:DsbA family protein [Erwinia sp. V71]|uniref:DsbA family protein n=1 Tax=Erwinia sp. V71 TaxID=3369424 RepID=UPI003F5D5F5F